MIKIQLVYVSNTAEHVEGFSKAKEFSYVILFRSNPEGTPGQVDHKEVQVTGECEKSVTARQDREDCKARLDSNAWRKIQKSSGYQRTR